MVSTSEMPMPVNQQFHIKMKLPWKTSHLKGILRYCWKRIVGRGLSAALKFLKTWSRHLFICLTRRTPPVATYTSGRMNLNVWPRNIMLSENASCRPYRVWGYLCEVWGGDTWSNTVRREIDKRKSRPHGMRKDVEHFTGINNVCCHWNGEFAGTDLIIIHYKPMHIN